MRFQRYLFLLFTLTFSLLKAQDTRLSFELAKLAELKSPSRPLAVLIKGNPEKIRKAVEECGGQFLYHIGQIASVRIPSSSLRAFATYPFVNRIEQGSIHLHPLNDTMVYLNNVVPVHQGLSPLPRGYDGSGIVCGFIDTGIDFSHPDFKDSTGKSRIKFIWDQNQPVATNTPLPFNYGQEWTNIQIDSGKCTEADTNQWGHGTRVAGTAAGNGLAVNRYGGVAPKADIIVVAVGFGVNAPVISDAANYIFTKAQSMGKPCVINCSLGSEIGSHDGRDLETQLIDSMILQKKGRVFVAAAGNSGDSPIHLSNNLQNDSSSTWLRLNANDTINGNTLLNVQIYGDTTSMKQLRFALAADNTSSPYSVRARTSFHSYASNTGIVVTDTLKSAAGNSFANVQFYQQITGNTYMLQYAILADSACNFRLITQGSGKYDAWSYNFIASGIPTPSVFPALTGYKLPDSEESIETGFQCSPYVISVANYVNKNCFADEGDTVICDTNFVFRPRRLAPSSSHGPTRLGLQKPDIAATGDYVISCFVVALRRWFNSTQIARGGMHMPGGGTSQASPVVAGIAALYLQQNPNAGYLEVKNAILCGARSDVYTGTSLPDYKWGFGKADAFNALTLCTPLYVGGTNPIRPDFFVWPNPIEESAAVSWESMQGSGLLSVNDILGREMLCIPVKEGMKSLTLPRGNLAPGIYFVELKINGYKTLSRKVAVH